MRPRIAPRRAAQMLRRRGASWHMLAPNALRQGCAVGRRHRSPQGCPQALRTGRCNLCPKPALRRPSLPSRAENSPPIATDDNEVDRLQRSGDIRSKWQEGERRIKPCARDRGLFFAYVATPAERYDVNCALPALLAHQPNGLNQVRKPLGSISARKTRPISRRTPSAVRPAGHVAPPPTPAASECHFAQRAHVLRFAPPNVD